MPAGAAAAAAGTPLDDAPDVLAEEEDAVRPLSPDALAHSWQGCAWARSCVCHSCGNSQYQRRGQRRPVPGSRLGWTEWFQSRQRGPYRPASPSQPASLHSSSPVGVLTFIAIDVSLLPPSPPPMQVNLMTVWLGMGIGTLFLSLSALSFGTCAALCSIVGASQHVCSCCRGPDIAGAIKVSPGSVAALAFAASLGARDWGTS